MSSFIYTLAKMVNIEDPEMNALNMLEWCTLARQMEKCPHCDEPLDIELDMIKKARSALCIHLMMEIKDFSSTLGYPMYVSGAAGGSYIAYLMELSPFNPAPPFAYCPDCERVIESIREKSYICSQCKEEMIVDGFNLPPFSDFDERNSEAFEITLAPEVKEKIIDYLNETFYYFQIDDKTARLLLEKIPTDPRLSKIKEIGDPVCDFEINAKRVRTYQELMEQYISTLAGF